MHNSKERTSDLCVETLAALGDHQLLRAHRAKYVLCCGELYNKALLAVCLQPVPTPPVQVQLAPQIASEAINVPALRAPVIEGPDPNQIDSTRNAGPASHSSSSWH